MTEPLDVGGPLHRKVWVDAQGEVLRRDIVSLESPAGCQRGRGGGGGEGGRTIEALTLRHAANMLAGQQAESWEIYTFKEGDGMAFQAGGKRAHHEVRCHLRVHDHGDPLALRILLTRWAGRIQPCTAAVQGGG